MKRTVVLALTCIGASLYTASNATVMNVTFQGGDIVADWNLPEKTNDVPKIGDAKVQGNDNGREWVIRTYNGATAADPEGFNKWLNSMTADEKEGLGSFNLWLQGGVTEQASWWGETLQLTDATSDAITMLCPEGWKGELVHGDWGSPWDKRWIISYYCTDAKYYLRSGFEGTFGFTADVSGYNGGTGSDYQIWVGAGSVSDEYGTHDNTTGAYYFQRAIGAQGERAVPGPAAILPFVGGLIAARLRRRK